MSFAIIESRQDNYYNPNFYASEGILILKEQLKLLNHVYVPSFDGSSAARGQTINFTAPSVPKASGTVGVMNEVETLTPTTTTIKLDKYLQRAFKVNDIDSTLSEGRLVTDHIAPYMSAMARDVELAVYNVAKRVPWKIPAMSSAKEEFITIKQRLSQNNVNTETGDITYLIDPIHQSNLLRDPIFSSQQVLDMSGKVIMSGDLQMRYGITPVMSQIAAVAHTAGTLLGTAAAPTTDVQRTGTLVNAVNPNDRVLTIAGLSTGKTIEPGDALTIAQDKFGAFLPKYAVINSATVTVAGNVSIEITPAIMQTIPAGTAVTFDDGSKHNRDEYEGLIAFHRNAIAVIPRPLIQPPQGTVKSWIATDKETGLSLRCRIVYDEKDAGSTSVLFDVLMGYELLNPNAIVTVCRPKTFIETYA